MTLITKKSEKCAEAQIGTGEFSFFRDCGDGYFSGKLSCSHLLIILVIQNR